MNELTKSCLTRKKQQLRQQLLYGISVSNQKKTIKSISTKHHISNRSPLIDQFKVNNTAIQNSQEAFKIQRYIQNEQNQNCSILDQFSKCPFKDDQSLEESEQNILNKFYKKKNKLIQFSPNISDQSIFVNKNYVKQQSTNKKYVKQQSTNKKNLQTTKIQSNSNKYHQQKLITPSQNQYAYQLQKNGLQPKFQSQISKIPTKNKIIILNKNKVQTLSSQEDLPNSHKQKEVDKEQDEHVNKILQKKSSLKQLIINKQKQSSNDSQKSGSFEDLNSSELIRMLPNYESSSSGLDPVYEDELEDIQDSVKNTQRNLKVINKSNQKSVNDNIFEGFKHQNQLKAESSSHISEISLKDLQDISQIQKMSSDKLFSDEKQIQRISDQIDGRNYQNPSNSPSRNYQSSIISIDEDDFNHHSPKYSQKNQQIIKMSKNYKQNDQKNKAQKMMLEDIKKDVANLQNRISSEYDCSTSNYHKKPIKKESQQSGSSGPNNKSQSMMHFFQQINNKMDMREINKDISGLRDRILTESSYYQ